MLRNLLLPFILVLQVGTALALSPAERLADPALEARARDISAELRCLVCQNQSIDDSDAELARDLRRLVRERLSAGDTNDGVKTYLVQRYGEFVLLKPMFSVRTAVLWITPFAILLMGIFVARSLFRRRGGLPPEDQPRAPLTPDEQRELDALVGAQPSPPTVTNNSSR